MREIKFRGESIDGNEMLYGHYSNAVEKGDLLTWGRAREKTETLLHYIDNNVVYPNTVGQFTGLHDKNGVEIYEGDIVATGDGNYEIGYDMSDCVCIGKTETNRLRFLLCTTGVEVIGNIYDNPELLERVEVN